MLSIFRCIFGSNSPDYIPNPEKKHQYAIWKYFSFPEGIEMGSLGIVISNGNCLETKLVENFLTDKDHLKAEFSRVRDEIRILADHLNSKKEKRLKDMIDAFSREDHFRFSQARINYSLDNQPEALERLFRQYIGYRGHIRPNLY